MIDEKKIKEYIKNPNFCPFCNSRHFQYDNPEIYEGYIEQVAECSDCGKKWLETHTLSNIEEMTS